MKNVLAGHIAVLIVCAGIFMSSVIVAFAAPELGPWQSYIKSGKTFYVNFDTANFDDSGWKGSSDPMGTLMAGKIYTIRYTAADMNWSVSGFNEGTKGIYSTSYQTQRPDDMRLNLWGRVYTFTNDGVVTDSVFGAVGHLQRSETEKNKFPITKLGNCKDQSSCKTYCDDKAHIVACTDYAEENGMISKEEAARAREFADVLRGDGPGACKDQKTCEAYCNGVAHLDECLLFAERHNLIPKDVLQDAKRISRVLAEGATLPGGCTDKKSCESYCADTTHADECLTFAEKAGFIDPKDVAESRRVLPFMKSGETPGKCTTKALCEAYCSESDHADECVNFAEKAGLISKEDAEMARKTGGEGPGGCRSRETCEAYCNDTSHQEECFKFAEKYGLIPAEQLKEIKDGMGQLRAGLPQLPEEARVCLKEKLGEEALAKISEGTFMPTQNMGQLIKGCMADMMPKIKEKISAAMDIATPEAKACIEKGLGSSGLDKMLSGGEMDAQSGDIVRKCFESMRESGMQQAREGLEKMPPEMRACIEEKLGKDVVEKIMNGDGIELSPDMGNAFQSCAANATAIMDKMLEQAPAEMRDCIKSKIGDVSTIRGPEDVQPFIAECMQSFRPAGMPAGIPKEGIPEAGYRPEGVPKSGELPAGIPTGMMPPAGASGGGMPANVCENFKLAPSCDYVPENVRDLCKQCKSGAI
ncbi:MAG: hypothetical protein A2845_02830 [Candidatus Lloydbacteria bacterium RIFCSPHIGHO2_01_FULL_49_22]|uniref:Uncharacterized protein n=1 Tax=Candidatus Lloydbacteria bacterium RIFCSPHIGHO2_01_FULL_49_22 TaxID=1798658 RepID=A0A1G2CVE3_9BACT|nr:MAG: hypothetical protein A2845_02830 [Candidatus Lloydbacteria bacterium RIFCSPHIGHO2_01_FULL_49_22]OGZ10379.1 MAG: hypothetical protein A3C14_02530 [Candidatus Lloydbacteria bacterium RIFCSPHIGHO2_02_FULL_50_18]